MNQLPWSGKGELNDTIRSVEGEVFKRKEKVMARKNRSSPAEQTARWAISQAEASEDRARQTELIPHQTEETRGTAARERRNAEGYRAAAARVLANTEMNDSNSAENPDDSQPSISSGSVEKSGHTSGFHVAIGDGSTFSKTVSESDVYMFAGITGDFSPNHVNKPYMEKSKFGKLMAHGALLVGFMSTASSAAIAHCRGGDETPVSLGYDRIRFVAPVFLGDTVTVDYRFTSIDTERKRTEAEIIVTNQNGETVGVAIHHLKWIPDEG